MARKAIDQVCVRGLRLLLARRWLRLTRKEEERILDLPRLTLRAWEECIGLYLWPDRFDWICNRLKLDAAWLQGKVKPGCEELWRSVRMAYARGEAIAERCMDEYLAADPPNIEEARADLWEHHKLKPRSKPPTE